MRLGRVPGSQQAGQIHVGGQARGIRHRAGKHRRRSRSIGSDVSKGSLLPLVPLAKVGDPQRDLPLRRSDPRALR
eukprot:1892114-Alexandrium_andersonii.AAC.1